MAKSFRTLRDKMGLERRTQNEQRATEMLVELALQDLRKSLHLTQEQVAEMMQMNQAAISKMERQNDIYVSTLRRFVSALGGMRWPWTWGTPVENLK
jgi:DNA-binding XRE family transcriptional regulator